MINYFIGLPPTNLVGLFSYGNHTKLHFSNQKWYYSISRQLVLVNQHIDLIYFILRLKLCKYVGKYSYY